jgi:putative transposase
VHRHRWAQAPAAPGCGEQGERSLLDRVPQHACRGLRLPTTATSDGAPGLIQAIEVCFPTTVRIRCWFHRLANIRAKLPDEAAGEVLAHLYAVRDAPTLDAARAAADRFTNTYARDYPPRWPASPTTSTLC